VKALALPTLALLALAALPVSAQTPAPASSATPPLRHLVFGLKIATNYSSELKGIRDIADPQGAPGVTTQNSDRGEGTITCDVIAARDNGDLLVDVSETLRGQATPVSRIVLHGDGQLSYLPKQKPIAPEAALLIPFLARNYIGPQAHTVGENWSVDDNFDNFKGTTKFKITAVRAPSDVSVEVEQDFTTGGTQSSTGVIRGRANYDPIKIVLREGSFDMRSRTQQGEEYRVFSSFTEFTLREDTFAKR
jgi:hypothetical protein